MAVDPSSLPAVVRRHVERVLPGGAGGARSVRIAQTGEMILKPGARPRRFAATEELSVDRVAFHWRAAFPVLGPIGLRVTDSYDSGEGRLEARLLGLPLQRRRGPELGEAEAYRYLAEIPWVPHAILANPELEWAELDDHAVEVGTIVAGERIALRLEVGADGTIARTYAERPRAEAGGARTPWIGEYSDYRAFGEITVPARGEVSWQLAEGPFTYWRGMLSSLEVLG